MDKIEKIRTEIERLKNNSELAKMEWIDEGYNLCAFAEDCKIGSFDTLLSFLDTLSEEPDRPEPYTGKYDEAYLNEKIKKATESWKGVDVDAMLAECRGYDEEKSKEPVADDLEEEVKKYFQGYWPGTETAEQCNTDLHFTPPAILRLARHFAEWQAEKDKETIELAEDHAYLAGAVNEREQMMKEAVEGYVNYYEDSGGILMAEAQVGCPYHNGDKVKLIIIKDDGKSD